MRNHAATENPPLLRSLGRPPLHGILYTSLIWSGWGREHEETTEVLRQLLKPLPTDEATSTTLCFRFSEMPSAPTWHDVLLPCFFLACPSTSPVSALPWVHDDA